MAFVLTSRFGSGEKELKLGNCEEENNEEN